MDIDVYDPDVAQAIEAMLWDLIGTRGMVRFGEAPKRAALFRTETPFAKISTRSDTLAPLNTTVPPPVNWTLLHQHAGIDVKVEKKAHLQLSTGASDLVAAATDAVGIETGGMDTPIAVDPDTGQRWRPRFDAKTLVHEERMLQAACYVVCAYLTGMRDCEVQAMRAGCLALTRSADGMIERHRVRSVAYKGRSSRGERLSWCSKPGRVRSRSRWTACTRRSPPRTS